MNAQAYLQTLVNIGIFQCVENACFTPLGSSTRASRHHSFMIDSDTPPSRSAAPKASSDIRFPNQFTFSARPSNGDAEAWTPLFPLSQPEESPSSSHREAMVPRIDFAGASLGSVGPMSAPR